MCTGEGGAIVANKENFGVLDEVEMLARYGKTELFGPPYCEYPGYSNRMTEILCAVGVVTDRYVQKKIARRRGIAAIYNDELQVDAKLYGRLEGQNFYKYVVYPNMPAMSRDEFKRKMKYEFGIGIPAGVYDFPVYKQKPLSETEKWPLKNSENFCGDHICLPMHEGLTDEDAMFVAKAVNEVLGA